jgi:hypothetical protein
VDVKCFLELTASDTWLTVSEIMELLNAGDYWASGQSTSEAPEGRLDYVRRLVHNLSRPTGEIYFANLAMRASDGSTVLVYKQQRWIRPAARRRSTRRVKSGWWP